MTLQVLCCILQLLLHILYINYKCLMKGKRLKRQEGERDVRGQGAGTVEMLSLDILGCHFSVAPSIH